MPKEHEEHTIEMQSIETNFGQISNIVVKNKLALPNLSTTFSNKQWKYKEI